MNVFFDASFRVKDGGDFFCPNCGVVGLLWLDGVQVFVCEVCDGVFSILFHVDDPDVLRRVADE